MLRYSHTLAFTSSRAMHVVCACAHSSYVHAYSTSRVHGFIFSYMHTLTHQYSDLRISESVCVHIFICSWIERPRRDCVHILMLSHIVTYIRPQCAYGLILISSRPFPRSSHTDLLLIITQSDALYGRFIVRVLKIPLYIYI